MIMKLLLTLILCVLVTGVQAEELSFYTSDSNYIFIPPAPNITITEEDVLVCIVDLTKSIVPVLICQKMGEVGRDKPGTVIPFDPTKIKIWDGKRLW